MQQQKPTVSQLLDLLNKPALMHWANKIGLQGISLKDYRAKSTTTGTALHKQVELFFKENLPLSDSTLHQKLCVFAAKYEIVTSEPIIECNHYRGRADLLMRRDDKLYLFDFKPPANRVYLEQILQLVAYKYVLGAHYIGIVRLDTFQEGVIPLTEIQEIACMNIIMALVTVYGSKGVLSESGIS
jgi:hypothetical protein